MTPETSQALYKAIFERRSVRKYSDKPVDSQTMQAIQDFAENTAQQLYPHIGTTVDIVSPSAVGKLGVAKAPHFLLFYSEAAADNSHLLNTGFYFQQLDLFLHTLRLGRCWQGMVRPKQREKDGLTQLAALSFGYPADMDALTRTISDFKRKPLAEVASGDDPRLEAARLAPSGINAQKWFFAARNGAIDVFRAKPGPLSLKLYNDMSLIDAGIALCHLQLASTHHNLPFSPTKLPKEKAPTKEGFEYLITI
jgi:nitroreductase